MNDKESKCYRLCFGRRPAVELYDCDKDPDQINNLAGDPEYKETVKQLLGQLVRYLRQTDDPRFTDEPVKFDQYPYRAAYLKKHLEAHGYKL